MPGLKYIKIPEDVKFIDKFTGLPYGVTYQKEDGSLDVKSVEPVSFKVFVLRILEHESWRNMGFEVLCAAHSIARTVEDAKPGSVVVLAGDDWSLLVEKLKAVYHQMFSFSTLVLIQLMPLFEAIINASDKNPEVSSQ